MIPIGLGVGRIRRGILQQQQFIELSPGEEQGEESSHPGRLLWIKKNGDGKNSGKARWQERAHMQTSQTSLAKRQSGDIMQPKMTSIE
jgi:hypothetical protein